MPQKLRLPPQDTEPETPSKLSLPSPQEAVAEAEEHAQGFVAGLRLGVRAGAQSVETVAGERFEESAQAGLKSMIQSSTVPAPFLGSPDPELTKARTEMQADPEGAIKRLRLHQRKLGGEQFVEPQEQGRTLRRVGEATRRILQPIDPETGAPNVEPAISPGALVKGIFRRFRRAPRPALKPTAGGKPPPGGGGKPPTAAATVPPKPAVDPEDFLNFRRLNVSKPEKENLKRLVVEQVEAAGDAPKKRVSFADVRREAEALDPKLVQQLKRPKLGETIRPEVRLAARERLNTLNDEALKRTEQLKQQGEALTETQKLDIQKEVDSLEKDAKGLLDVLIPTRSQDGRNLAFHRIMAQRSFDTEFWVSRAKHKSAGALTEIQQNTITRILTRGRAAEAAKDAAGVRQARIDLADAFRNLDRTSPVETITALRKAGLLTGIKTQVRNIGGNTAFQAMNELARGPGSIADIGLSLFTGQRTVAGLSLKAMAAGGREAATRGVREAVEIMQRGATSEQLSRLDIPREVQSTLFGGGTKADAVVNAYTNFVFRTMVAGDRPFRAFAFRRSLEGRARVIALNEARRGQIPRRAVQQRAADLSRNPTQEMLAESVADSEVAVFAEQTPLTTGIGRFRTALPEGGRFLMDLVIPFQKTPTNIVTQLIRFTGVDPGAAKAAGRALITRSMTQEQQKTIAGAIGRGLVGQALIYTGYKLAEKGLATGVRSSNSGQRATEEAAGRLPGAILVDGRWRQIAPFSPAGNLLTIGATIQRESTQPLRDEASRVGKVAAIAGRTVLEQPLATGARDVFQALENPVSSGERAVTSIAGSFVPTMAADIGRLTDDVRRSTFQQGSTASIRERLPGLRKTLPVRTDVLGRPQRQEARSFADPTIATLAQEKSNPAIRELIANRVGVGRTRRRLGETVEEHQARGNLLGRAIERSIRQEISQQDYQDLESEDKRFLLERAVRRARQEISKIVRAKSVQEINPEGRSKLYQEEADAIAAQFKGEPAAPTARR